MPDAITPASAANRNYRSLVVRSGPEIDQLLQSLFQQEKWEIQFAEHNTEALQLAKDTPFDLIITGERTPGKEDVELLRRLRLVRPHTRLIILTEEFIPGDVLAAIRGGAVRFFLGRFSSD